MTETLKKLKVFLCHSSQDKSVVREIYKRLGAEGWIDPWLDEKKILPGQDWNMEIEKAVETSHIVLVFLTNNSVSKEGYVQRELRMVLDVALNMPEDTIFVIPVKLEKCQMPRRLAAWQWVNYFPAEERADAYDRMLASLMIRASKLGISITTYSEKETPALPPRKTISHSVEKPLLSNPDDSDLDLYIPPEYMDRPFGPPPARVKTWLFGGIEFIKIPRGEFFMGSEENNGVAYEDEKPQFTFSIPYDFLIARFPVTNEQYEKFTKATSYSTRAEKEGFGWVWNGKEWFKTYGANWRYPRGPQTNIEGLSKHPVVLLTWADGIAYFEWLHDVFGKDVPAGLVFRAPTEAEWERSARGTDGREYPWGNEFNIAYCNSREAGRGITTQIGTYSPLGDSPYGVCDMAGNVWEMTISLWGKKPEASDFLYPYNPRDGRENVKADADVLRVIRGGSYTIESQSVRTACRSGYYPGNWGSNVGLRVVLAPRLP